jgi:hypothetical protein
LQYYLSRPKTPHTNVYTARHNAEATLQLMRLHPEASCADLPKNFEPQPLPFGSLLFRLSSIIILLFLRYFPLRVVAAFFYMIIESCLFYKTLYNPSSYNCGFKQAIWRLSALLMIADFWVEANLYSLPDNGKWNADDADFYDLPICHLPQTGGLLETFDVWALKASRRKPTLNHWQTPRQNDVLTMGARRVV